MPPNAPPLEGRTAIQESAAGLLGAGANLRFETAEVKVAASGDMAITRGRYFLTLETPGGLIEDEGSYLEVWEKVDGEWKITTDIYNTDLPSG
jgi:ketosteroid isomerase-like protein